MDFDTLIKSLSNAKRRTDDEYRAKCPAHNGTSSDSLAISRGDNGDALLFCHAGCTYKDVVTALGIKQKTKTAVRTTGKLASPNKHPKQKPIITQVYQYTDEAGAVLFEKVRLDPKSFRVRVPSGNGQYVWKIGNTRRVLYNLPAVIESDVIYIVEGEKDADRLNSLGLVATCNFDGASANRQKPKWATEYNPFFADKTVFIFPDNDEPGDSHAANIKQQISDLAKSVKIVDLPDLDPAGDVSDWLNNGGTVDKLLDICKRDQPIKHKWKIRTLKDAFQELTPTEYIIDPILPKRSLSIWFGAPGSLKSMILMDLTFAIMAAGEFIPGRQNDKMLCSKARVLWIDLDNGNDVLKERLSAMARARNISEDENGFIYVTMPDPWLFISDVNSQMDLKALINDFKADLVIIDNLSTITGDIDENSASMVRVMAPLRAMTAELDTAFILIHHQRKGGAGAGGRAGDALRGHSVIEASLDYAIHIANDESSNIANIKCTKARRFKFDDFKAKYNFEHKEGTNDLDIVWFSSPVLRAGTNEVYDAIVKMLELNVTMTQEKLKEDVYDYLDRKYSKPKISSWMKEMAEVLDVIDIKKGPHNSKVMSLKNA
ncbi:MAG: hypothetical protein DRI46_13175 [Chloroflexi bacterium]|nr:MAG: hypothetical protein DRI46_13175 [Chloroflexota bacterium]